MLLTSVTRPPEWSQLVMSTGTPARHRSVTVNGVSLGVLEVKSQGTMSTWFVFEDCHFHITDDTLILVQSRHTAEELLLRSVRQNRNYYIKKYLDNGDYCIDYQAKQLVS